MYSAVPEFAARQRRIYRAQSAAFLANLDLTCTADELVSIDWMALESVPHWCFLPANEQRALRLLCGAVFLAPQMHAWIEGQRIQSVRELIGPEAYDLVLRSTNPLVENPPLDEVSGDMASALEQAGKAVLLGAIAHPVIQVLVTGPADNDQPCEPLAAQIANPLYQRALEIFVKLRQPAQSLDSIAADTVPETTPETAAETGSGAGA